MRLLHAALFAVTATSAAASGVTPNYANGGGYIEPPSADEYFNKVLKGEAGEIDETVVDLNNIRISGIRDAAIAIGSQAGAHYEALRFNHFLVENEQSLNSIFDFAPLLIEDDGARLIQPAVVGERQSFARVGDGGQTMRLAAHHYRIEQPAQFVLRSPTWRDYLYYTAPQPEQVDARVKPRTKLERQQFEKFAKLGWDAGVEQARLEIDNRLARLSRDYVGIIRYHLLNIKGYLQDAEVEKDFFPVTGGGDEMVVEDVVLTIKTPSFLDAATQNWRPIPQLPNFDYLGYPFKEDFAWDLVK